MSQLLLIMLPSLSLTMFMLFFTVVEVARVRNSRNMMAWSLYVGRVSWWMINLLYRSSTCSGHVVMLLYAGETGYCTMLACIVRQVWHFGILQS